MTPTPHYVYVSVDLFAHPRIMPLRAKAPLALLAYLQGLAYSQKYLTDGFLPQAWADQFPQQQADALVAHELWRRVEDDPGPGADPDPDRCGYMIDQFLAYQISRSSWTEEGQRRSDRARRAARARWDRKAPPLRAVTDISGERP